MNTDLKVLVGKAATNASTADTTYQQLNGEQSAQFMSKVVEQSVMTKYANIMPIKGNSFDFNHIDLSSKIAVGLGENDIMAGTADETLATFSGRRLTPESVRMFAKISTAKFAYTNIEGPAAIQKIQDMMAVEFGNGIEEICVKSELGGTTPAGYGTDMLSIIDGWRSLADSGNIYDHSGANFNTTLFRELWNSVPSKWRGMPSDWKFFLPINAKALLWDLFAQRSTNLGDGLLMGSDGGFKFLGVDLEFVPYIPTDVAGTLTQSASESLYTWVMLCRPKDMYIGYNPAVKTFIHPDAEGTFLNVSLWAEMAPQFAQIETVATAVNVTLNVTLPS